MKKSIVFLALVMILSLCLAGCGSTENEENLKVRNYSESYEVSAYGNEEDLDTLADVKISLDTESKLDLKKTTFFIENNSQKEYRYSEAYFEIEVEQAGIWYQLNQLDDPSQDTEMDTIIKPSEKKSLTIDISEYYGQLPTGHYRIIKQFSYFENSKDWDYDTYHLSCEFTIK